MQGANQSSASRDRSEAVLGLEVSLLMIAPQEQGDSHTAGLLSMKAGCDRHTAVSGHSGASAQSLRQTPAEEAGSPQSKKALISRRSCVPAALSACLESHLKMVKCED